ncbi:MAG: glycosyltransferase [Abditibacteriales bacterium]|nr:glycosyltransferase [Abditibacteriales bacterium]MDW8364266.1 glycosyltransferase [Abditibacteriales bacterium]
MTSHHSTTSSALPRVVFGPREIAGTFWGYRCALRALGATADVVVLERNPFGYAYDRCVPLPRLRPLAYARRLVLLLRLAREYDVFHLCFGKSICYPPLDVRLLRRWGKKIVMDFRGSEVRCNDGQIAEDLPACHCTLRGFRCNRREKERRLRFWQQHADAIFCGIAATNLLHLLGVPYQPLVVPCDLDYWKPFPSNLRDEGKGELLVVHAPSRRMVKGTEHVIKAVERLRAEGYPARLQLLEGVPNHEVREWVNAADIVVDQLLLGWHGVFAVESMALAKPTVCNLHPLFQARAPYAADIPLVNASPATIDEVLKRLVTDEPWRRALSERSRAYVEKVHDARKVAERLIAVYRGEG